MSRGETDYKADELDSIINVIGLRPNDPLDGFGGMALQENLEEITCRIMTWRDSQSSNMLH